MKGSAAHQALPATRIANTIMQVLDRIEPGGDVASVRQIREAPELKDVSKAEFDKAVMDLQNSKQVWLHEHSKPHLASETERQQLVDSGKGDFYVGMARRSAPTSAEKAAQIKQAKRTRGK